MDTNMYFFFHLFKFFHSDFRNIFEWLWTLTCLTLSLLACLLTHSFEIEMELFEVSGSFTAHKVRNKFIKQLVVVGVAFFYFYFNNFQEANPYTDTYRTYVQWIWIRLRPAEKGMEKKNSTKRNVNGKNSFFRITLISKLFQGSSFQTIASFHCSKIHNFRTFDFFMPVKWHKHSISFDHWSFSSEFSSLGMYEMHLTFMHFRCILCVCVEGLQLRSTGQ